ncbi:hypothetical protein Barb7_01449 [Bacteroidales bacterium Barb7]|nr:hypothetical protein Barb7_01449 [Bacteroidales bacterium Barb7]
MNPLQKHPFLTICCPSPQNAFKTPLFHSLAPVKMIPRHVASLTLTLFLRIAYVLPPYCLRPKNILPSYGH